MKKKDFSVHSSSIPHDVLVALASPYPQNCLLEENPLEAHWGNSDDEVALAKLAM
jgi:hypothetical protein